MSPAVIESRGIDQSHRVFATKENGRYFPIINDTPSVFLIEAQITAQLDDGDHRGRQR